MFHLVQNDQMDLAGLLHDRCFAPFGQDPRGPPRHTRCLVSALRHFPKTIGRHRWTGCGCIALAARVSSSPWTRGFGKPVTPIDMNPGMNRLIARRDLPILAVFLVLALGAVFLEPVQLLAVVAVLLAVAALPFGPWLVMPFFALLCGICEPLNDIPLELGSIRVYTGDGLFLLLASLLVVVLTRRAPWEVYTTRPLDERRIMKWHAAYLAWGLLALAIGLTRYPAADALGAYRRFYFYSMATPLVLLLPLSERQVRWMPATIWIAIAGIAVIGAYRIATGHTHRELYYVMQQEQPSPRLYSANGCSTLAMALAYSVALIRAEKAKWFQRAAGLLTGGLAVSLLALSGWRHAVGYIPIIPLVAVMFHSLMRGDSVWAIAKAVLVVALVVAVGLLTLMVAMPETVQDAMDSMVERIENHGLDTDARYFAWRAALRDLAREPLTGVGLGDLLFYAKRGSDGAMIMYHSTSHNMALTVLYQSGIPGFLLLAGLHLLIILSILRRSRMIRSKLRPEMTAVVMFYVSSVGFAAIQPQQIVNIVSMHLALGMALVLLRYTAPTGGENAGP
jgi:O-antigen ligase